MINKKFIFMTAASALFLLLSSCMTMSQGVPIGSVAEEGTAYLVGSFSINIPEEYKTPEKYNYLVLSFDVLDGESTKSTTVDVPNGEMFYVELPKSQYELKSITYFTGQDAYKAIGKNLVPSNIMVKDTYIDLTNSSYVYLGDISIENVKNPYGNFELSPVVKNSYTETLTNTDGWLMDSSGTSLKPEDFTSLWDNSYFMNNPFPLTLINYEVKFQKNKNLISTSGDSFDFDKSGSIAFLCVDMNAGTWQVMEDMEEYAVAEYSANLIDHETVGSTLPQYPSKIYQLNRGEEKKDALDFSEEYNTAFNSSFLKIANTLGVDYLYVLYSVGGIYQQTGKEYLYFLTKSRLFDVHLNKDIAESFHVENVRLKGLLNLAKTAEEMELELYRNHAQKLVDSLYK